VALRCAGLLVRLVRPVLPCACWAVAAAVRSPCHPCAVASTRPSGAAPRAGPDHLVQGRPGAAVPHAGTDSRTRHMDMGGTDMGGTNKGGTNGGGTDRGGTDMLPDRGATNGSRKGSGRGEAGLFSCPALRLGHCPPQALIQGFTLLSMYKESRLPLLPLLEHSTPRLPCRSLPRRSSRASPTASTSAPSTRCWARCRSCSRASRCGSTPCTAC
jgi:hypothetical protein